MPDYDTLSAIGKASAKPTSEATFAASGGSAKPRREDVARQLETALTELSHGNLLNVMVHSQRAAAMALELCESRRGSPNAAMIDADTKP